MASSSPVTPDMESSNLNNEFQAWSFEKAMLEAQQNSPSESSSAEFYDAEDRMRITPNIVDMEELKRTMEEQKSPAKFDDRYMSSEEDLSLTEHDDDSDFDDVSIYEAETAPVVRFGVCNMAVAICIISSGPAKVVDLPVPSLTSSPSIGSEPSIPERKVSTPPAFHKPIFRARNPARPAIETFHSGQSVADLTIPKSSQSFTSSTGSDSRRHSIFRAFTDQTPRPIYSPVQAPSFLSQDPFENGARPRPRHSRLRNLSHKFSRFAIYGGPKEADKAESTSIPTAAKLRRLSRAGIRRSQSHIQRDDAEPLTPTSSTSPAPKRKMVARGANERAPAPEIPDCPYDVGDDGEAIMPNRVRRRKSMLGF